MGVCYPGGASVTKSKFICTAWTCGNMVSFISGPVNTSGCCEDATFLRGMMRHGSKLSGMAFTGDGTQGTTQPFVAQTQLSEF